MADAGELGRAHGIPFHEQLDGLPNEIGSKRQAEFDFAATKSIDAPANNRSPNEIAFPAPRRCRAWAKTGKRACE